MYNGMYGNPYGMDNRNPYQNLGQGSQQGGITQNFQISPTNNNRSIRYAESTDEVKNELVFFDTLFVNKSYTQLWVKNTLGEIKTYELTEIIELDPKDEEIARLRAKISILESERENYDDTTDRISKKTTASTSTKKSSSISTSK